MSTLSMVLPKIETDATSRNYGRYIIGPLERGYGVTLGNALRRVLLSSLPGAAAQVLALALAEVISVALLWQALSQLIRTNAFPEHAVASS